MKLRIAVCDTGIGIPADKIDRLFKSFSQTDASISRRYGGTGLGLAIAKKLTERMGGEIGVDSASGAGSTFWIELPVTPADAADAECSSTRVDAAQLIRAIETLTAADRKLRVLVAEDNATNQLVVRAALERFGIVPDVAGNGLEAVDAVRRQTYDIVLMDVHMPEMDGLEATKVIRALNGPAASVPIIALTANAFARDIDECRAAGMNAHVGKPFRREDLAIVLAEALSGQAKFHTTTALDSAAACPALDWAVIEQFRADSDDETLRLLIDTFVQDGTSKLKRLSEIVHGGAGPGEAVRLAHSLKSAGAMAGAAALSTLAKTVEAKLRSNETLAEADAQEMQRLFAAYRDALAQRGLIAA